VSVSGSGPGGLSPSFEGSDADQFVSVDEHDRAFGRYHLRYEIAAGGMATVFLARSKGPAGFDRAVALKRIHPHLAKKKEFVEMFLDEARLSARITHPNVCSVFDFGEVSGTYFMAMEYLVGQPLSTLLRAMSHQPEIATSRRWHALAAKIIADACEGLHAAHELADERGHKLGVVHRDCSPHNIFVTYDGAVKVVDFGVAKSEGRMHQTQTGALKGKLGYMSPEQVRGQAVDRRLDVWALGVCLWELLAIKRLFGKRQEVELIQAVAAEPIHPPSSVRESIPAELDRIVMRALERDVSQRYPTARAMARELNAFVSTSGVSAGLADLSELMEELFARERETKLGVVASVLATGSDALVPGSKSGQRIIDPAMLPPTKIVERSLDSSEIGITTPGSPAFPDPGMGATTPGSPAFPEEDLQKAPPTVPFETAAPPAVAAPPPSRSWVPLALVAVVLALALGGIGVAVMTRSPTNAVTATPLTTAPATEVHPASALVIDRAPPVTGTRALEPEPVAVTPPPETEVVEPIAVEPAVEPPPTSAPTPTRTRPGTINVSVSGGWADIYVDGVLRGRSPRAIGVPAGRHDVELRAAGHEPGVHRAVVVRPGAISRVTISVGG
jgi:serine/threonine-protein kinase